MFKSIYILILCAMSLLLLTAWGAGSPQSIDLSKESQIKVPAAPQVQSDPIIVSNLDNTKYNPQVAYNSKHDEYLVVWERNDGDNPGIYGQRLNKHGEKIGTSPFSIAVGTKSRIYPAVDYDPINDRYLVVWSHDHDGSGSENDISGRFIPWQGSDLFFPEFKINDQPGYQIIPKIVYNSTKKEFLILWLNYSGGIPSEIMGARMHANGSGFTMNNRNILGTIPNLQYYYDLEFNPARNEYLITWVKSSPATNNDVFMTRLKWNCTILFPKENLIGSSKGSETEPTVAAWQTIDGYDGYLVIFRLIDTGGNDKLIGAYYAGNLNPYFGSAAVRETKFQEVYPTVTTNHQRDQMLVVWSQESSKTPGIFGVWGMFTNLSSQSNPAFEIAPPIGKSNPTIRIESNAVAGGRNSFLAAWEHERPSSNWRDIYARLIFSYKYYLPLTIKK